MRPPAAQILGKFPKDIEEDDAWKLIDAASEHFAGATSLDLWIAANPPYLIVRGRGPDAYDIISLEPEEFRLSPGEIKKILSDREEGKWRVEPPNGPFDL